MRRAALGLAALLALAGAARPQGLPPADPTLLPLTGLWPTSRPGGFPAALDILSKAAGPDGADFTAYPTRPVAGQPARLGMSVATVRLPAPVWTGEGEGFVADVLAQRLDFRTDALLPNSRVRFPSQLAEYQLGGTYYRTLGSGASWAVSASLGSASDKPFASRRESVASLSGFARLPDGPTDAWLVTLSLETNSQAGRNVPIPGLAYEWHPAAGAVAVVGFPFSYASYAPTKEWKFEASYLLLTNARAQASYTPFEGWTVYSAAAWHNQSWLRSGRRSRSDLFNWYEKRLEGGLCFAASSQVRFDAAGGFAFDRYFAENQGFSLGGRNRVDIGAGPYLGVRLTLSY